MTNALRYNDGKLEFHRLYWPAVEEEIKVFMDGSLKYPDGEDGTPNWFRLWGDNTPQVVLNSLMRHASAAMQGQVYDPESGRFHVAHIRCNTAMLIKYYIDQGYIKQQINTDYANYVANEKKVRGLCAPSTYGSQK